MTVVDHYPPIPEDIKYQWAQIGHCLHDISKQNPSHMLEIRVLLRNNIPTELPYPRKMALEPRSCIPLEASNGRVDVDAWWPIIRRLQSIKSRSRLATIKTWVIVGKKGLPALWVTPEVVDEED